MEEIKEFKSPNKKPTNWKSWYDRVKSGEKVSKLNKKIKKKSKNEYSDIKTIRPKKIKKKKTKFLKQKLSKKELTTLDLQNTRIATYVNNLKENATKEELRFKELLDLKKIQYQFQKPLVNKKDRNKFFVADFVLPKYRVVVEIDGGYHTTEEKIALDKWRDNIVSTNFKLKTIRFTNEYINENDFETIFKELEHRRILRS